MIDETKFFDRMTLCEPQEDGRRFVIGRRGDRYFAAGYLMPTNFDSRQQPKSLAMRLMEERNESDRPKLIRRQVNVYTTDGGGW